MKPEDLTKAPVEMVRIDRISTHLPNMRKSVGNVQSLARSIEDLGLIHPLLVTNDVDLLGDCGLPYALLVGKRRYQAAKDNKSTNVAVRIVSSAEAHDIIELQRHENEQRKALPQTEATAGRAKELEERIQDILNSRATALASRAARNRGEKGKEIEPLTRTGAKNKALKELGIPERTRDRDRRTIKLTAAYPELEPFALRSMERSFFALENAANGEERRRLRKFIAACQIDNAPRADEVSRALHNLVNHWYLEHRTELLDKLEKHPDAILQAALGDPVSIPKAFYGLAELADEIAKAIEKYPWEKVAPSTKAEVKTAAKHFASAVDLLKRGYDDARARLFASLKR